MEILKVKDLRKVYGIGETQVNALDGINLTVQRGELWQLSVHREVENDILKYGWGTGCSYQWENYC